MLLGPILKGTGCTVAANGDIFANYFALAPFVIRREDLGDAYLGRALLS
jgi:hypothetical protein